MKIRLSAPLQYDSVVDGDGLRMVLWCQGCELNCPGCHNPETHDVNGGKEVNVEDLLNEIKKKSQYYDGLTFSGGHPLLQSEACLIIAKECKKLGLNLWIYSGLKYENIIKVEKYKKLLNECDVLVDGAFVESKKDLTIPFRGSSNQRIIDLNETRNKGEIVLWNQITI